MLTVPGGCASDVRDRCWPCGGSVYPCGESMLAIRGITSDTSDTFDFGTLCGRPQHFKGVPRRCSANAVFAECGMPALGPWYWPCEFGSGSSP
eukprot:353517-Chlamydomonas_euryale.AAC.3